MPTSERHTWVSRDVPGSRRIVLSADAASVVLDGECDGVMRWTTDYLGAWWEVSTSSEVPAGTPRVQAVFDRVQHDRIAGDPACDGEPCMAFMGAGGLPRASADGTSVSAAIPEQGVCFRHDRSLREVRVVSGDERALRSATTRLAREVLTLQLQASDWYLVNAAGVVKDGSAVLALGKGVGEDRCGAHAGRGARLGPARQRPGPPQDHLARWRRNDRGQGQDACEETAAVGNDRVPELVLVGRHGEGGDDPRLTRLREQPYDRVECGVAAACAAEPRVYGVDTLGPPQAARPSTTAVSDTRVFTETSQTLLPLRGVLMEGSRSGIVTLVLSVSGTMPQGGRDTA